MLRLLSHHTLPTFLTFLINHNTMQTAEALTQELTVKDCFGHFCQPIEEYCYALAENCQKCSDICLKTSHNYKEADCFRDCREYVALQPFKDEIHVIQEQQSVFVILLILLIILISLRYLYELFKWLKHRNFIKTILHQMRSRKVSKNGKDTVNGGTTIQNICAINDIERAPSQIYSVNGVEGSVLTMTTPISVRYPAEDTTPTSQQTTEYSYVNEALAVTPTTPAVV